MLEIGKIDWQLMKPGPLQGMVTIKLKFQFREKNAPVGDARNQWQSGAVSYLWDATKLGSKMEKEIVNTCRIKIGLPSIP